MLKYETDSRKIKNGQIFVAIKGATVDGHDYIDAAIANGASSVIAERDVKCSVPMCVVPNSEAYLKEKLAEAYANDLNKLKIIGVTGTNGKTTSCYLTYQLLRSLNVNAAYLGTIGFYYKDEVITTANTTPDTLTLYKYLMEALEAGVDTVVMEISSHALSLDRLHALHLNMAAFTNLTEDHLDFHKTMEEYLKAKLQITDLLTNNGTLIVNADDKSSQKFQEKYPNNTSIGFNGEYKIEDYETFPDHTIIKLKYKQNAYPITTNLTSKFNIYNYLTALSICHELGYSLEEIINKTKELVPPKGRCQTIKVNNGYAIIDYAHTPDAVEKITQNYTELKKNRVITIIGCGGDRDPLKRPIMGKIATENSDFTILTNDNPRTEEPEDIMKDILKGITSDNFDIEYDRKEAIKKGIEMMQPEDILLILGKGHEDYQIIGHTKHHLDDAEEVLSWQKQKSNPLKK